MAEEAAVQPSLPQDVESDAQTTSQEPDSQPTQGAEESEDMPALQSDDTQTDGQVTSEGQGFYPQQDDSDDESGPHDEVDTRGMANIRVLDQRAQEHGKFTALTADLDKACTNAKGAIIMLDQRVRDLSEEKKGTRKEMQRLEQDNLKLWQDNNSLRQRLESAGSSMGEIVNGAAERRDDQLTKAMAKLQEYGNENQRLKERVRKLELQLGAKGTVIAQASGGRLQLAQ